MIPARNMVKNERVGKLQKRRWGLKKISSKNIDFEISKIDFEKKILKMFEIFSFLADMEEIPFVKGNPFTKGISSMSAKNEKISGFFFQNQFSKFQN